MRDADGIAKGGIRLPQVEVPIATNSAIPRAADIFGDARRIVATRSARTISLLVMTTAAKFLAKFEAAAKQAEAAGVLLPRDVQALVDEAAASWDAAVGAG